MPELSVPTEHCKILMDLASQRPDELDSVIKNLDSYESSVDSVMSFLERSVGEREARILLMLQTSRLVYGYTASEAWDAVEHSYGEKSSDSSRIVALLESQTLIQTARAGELLGSTPAQLRASKVVTDFRPIFSEEKGHDLSSGILLHTLKLVYSSFDDSKELYLTLDLDDVKSLQKELDKTIRQHEVIKNFIVKNNISIINGSEEG